MNRCSLMLKNIASGNLLRSLSKNIHVAYYADASCPSISLLARLSCVSREKSLVHTVCTCLVTPGFGNFRKICFIAVTLRGHRLLFYKRCLPLTTLCVDDNEGSMKAISSLLAGIILASIHSSQMLWHQFYSSCSMPCGIPCFQVLAIT